MLEIRVNQDRPRRPMIYFPNCLAGSLVAFDSNSRRLEALNHIKAFTRSMSAKVLWYRNDNEPAVDTYAQFGSRTQTVRYHRVHHAMLPLTMSYIMITHSTNTIQAQTVLESQFQYLRVQSGIVRGYAAFHPAPGGRRAVNLIYHQQQV